MSEKPRTARSYRGAIVDDNAVISLNIKFLANVILAVGALVYGYWKVETRIATLESKVLEADEQIGSLLDKHIVEERIERAELAEKVKFYEKEFNINPLSWGRRKRK
tara:strand:- start:430 stop:750 length:321 start_codon:yes stop_codon:yes gene_type:complete